MLVENKGGVGAPEMSLVGLKEFTVKPLGKAAKTSENGTLNGNGKILNGHKEINGIKKINGLSRVRQELQTAPTERTDALKGFGDTMLMSDIIKNGEEIELFRKVFDGNVTHEGRDVTLSGSDARIGIVSREKGKALLATHNVAKNHDEWHSLSNAAVRDIENTEGPALDVIFPKAENGSVKVISLTRDAVIQRTISEVQSEDDEIAVAIAKRLPKAQTMANREEDFEPYKVIARDDLPPENMELRKIIDTRFNIVFTKPK